MSADFRRYYHCNLDDVLAGRVASLREVAAWAAFLPQDSAVENWLNPARLHTFELEMLRRVEQHTAWLVWAQTSNAKHGTNVPELFRFPWEDPAPSLWEHDVLEWDEAADALGGDPRLVEAMALL